MNQHRLFRTMSCSLGKHERGKSESEMITKISLHSLTIHFLNGLNVLSLVLGTKDKQRIKLIKHSALWILNYVERLKKVSKIKEQTIRTTMYQILFQVLYT